MFFEFPTSQLIHYAKMSIIIIKNRDTLQIRIVIDEFQIYGSINTYTELSDTNLLSIII
jgi:hypothetical protein